MVGCMTEKRATMKIRRAMTGDIVFDITLAQQVVFTGVDGSEIRVYVDNYGFLRLSCDETLAILPMGTNSARVIELRDQKGSGQ